LGKIGFPRRFCSCELIFVIVFGIGSHIMILQIISFLVILIIPPFSSTSILSGAFLGNRTADPFETWHKNRSSLKVVQLVFKIFKMATNMLKNYKKHKMIIAGYSPNRNWWNSIGTTSTSRGTT
jgi:predicted membrane chloride channel (bestrophin family)